jgi:hypothetical protein
MRRILSLALALIAAGLAGAASAEEKTVDAAKVFAMLDKFYAAPPAERSLLALRYTLTHDGRPATDLHPVLIVGGKRTAIPIAADGRVERLPTAAELAAHAQVGLDAQAGMKFTNHLSLDTAIRPAQEISAAECVQAIDQANAAIRRAAGVMAMLAPKVKAVTFIGAGSGVAVLADGKTAPLPLIKGAPAYDPEALKNVKTLRLAKAPTLVSLE